jgi:hypothetical protein
MRNERRGEPQGLVALGAIACLILSGACRGEEWRPPPVQLSKDAKHPVVACTPEELGRLRAAWAQAGPDHDVVAGIVTRADQALKQPLVFPPRGGQHNQWYQCDACQVALKTLDDTHHQCPRCQKIYSGEPYDDVIFARRHNANLTAMADAARAWAVTGKKEYAELAARVLLGYAERYTKYPYHSTTIGKDTARSTSGGHLFEQTLDEAEAMSTRIAPAYDLVHDSGVLSPQDHEAVRSGLLVPMLRNIDKHRAGKSNWQTWHNAAFIWGGAVLGDAAWVRQALEDPANGFAYQMKASVSSDGMWYENSWGYHFYTLQAMVLMAEGARRIGVDLWSHPTLARMFTLPVRYTMADGSLPRFGDDVRSSASNSSYLLEAAYHATKDPALAPLLTARPSLDTAMFGRAPSPRERPRPEGSEVFRGAGHAILRTKGEAGLSAALTFGPYGGFHGHFDKLSFVFFGWGKELGVDPGRAASQAYRLPVHTHWYKATLGHNGALVDAAPQKPAEGKLESFASTDAYAAAVASGEAAYPGVRHRRLLCMTPAYLVCVDDLAADKERRFDWVYHNRGSAVQCPAAGKDDKLAEDYPGQEYVNHVKSGVTDGPIKVEFVGDGVTTHLFAAGRPRTEIRTGDGVGASVTDRVPMAMITRRGAAARFACVLEPVPGGRQPTVTAVSAEEASGTVRVTVTGTGAPHVITLSPDSRVEVTCGGTTVLKSK